MVNDWKAAKALQQFKVVYLDPSDEKIADARKIMDDPNYKWKSGEKKAATNKFKRLEGENINYHRLYSAVMDLIKHHEAQTDMLTEIYALWYKSISIEGRQPQEMMNMQTKITQTIWERVYAALEPLSLPILPPKSDEKRP